MEKEHFMKVADFITSLLAAIVLLGGDILPFTITFFLTLLDVAFYNSPELDKAMAESGVLSFAASFAIVIIFVVVLILSIVGFVLGRRSNKKFTVIYSIVIALTAIGYGLSFPVAKFTDDIVHTDGAYCTWAYCGLVFIPILLILTVINGIVNRNKNAAV